MINVVNAKKEQENKWKLDVESLVCCYEGVIDEIIRKNEKISTFLLEEDYQDAVTCYGFFDNRDLSWDRKQIDLFYEAKEILESKYQNGGWNFICRFYKNHGFFIGVSEKNDKKEKENAYAKKQKIQIRI